jgi:hypothetical protein
MRLHRWAPSVRKPKKWRKRGNHKILLNLHSASCMFWFLTSNAGKSPAPVVTRYDTIRKWRRHVDHPSDRSGNMMALGADASAPRSIVFIDRGIADAATLAAGVRPGVAVAWLERDRPALDQIADRLADGPPVAALHVVSHGRPGVLGFSAGEVDAATLPDHAEALARVRTALAPDAEVLLYACSLAQGQGASFVRDLERVLGAPVHASATPTGSARLGGDWSFHTGTPRAQLAFTSATVTAFPSILSVFNFASDTVDGNNVSQTVDGITLTISISNGQSLYIVDGFSVGNAGVSEAVSYSLTFTGGTVDMYLLNPPPTGVDVA